MSVLLKRARTSSGFTISELLVAMVVTSILIVSIIGTISTWLGQYAIGSIREQQTVNLETALGRMGTDIRQSSSVLVQNTETDANAPTTPGNWITSSNQLVLGKTPHNSSGTGLYDAAPFFIGKSDSIIYYLKNGTLYRRVVPANYAGNVLGTTPISCSPADPNGGCTGDSVILSNVTQLQFTYYDASNTSGATPAATRSVAVNITTSVQQSGQTIVSQDSIRNSVQTLTTLTPPPPSGGSNNTSTPTQTSAALAVGPGGLQVGFANITRRDIYVKGPVVTQYMATINTTSGYRFDVANIGCGTRSTFPVACSAQPLTMTWASTATGDPICATGQTITTGLTGLQAGCTTPTKTMPSLNKSNFTATMQTTINGDLNCTFFNTQSIANKTTINGNVNANYCMNLSLAGDAYITGNLTASGSTIKVAEGITSRPVIYVNGTVNLSNTSILPNSRGFTPYIISFYSTNSSCMNSTSCNNVANSDIYDAINSTTPAITVQYLSTIAASLYAYFGTLNVSTTNVTGALAGQEVIIGNNSAITLTDGVWPT